MMIASIHGEIQEKTANSVIVEAGGIGYLVQVSRLTLGALPEVGNDCRLWTHFHVREDRQQLFGFAELEEKKAFELLLTVKGVGPRLALAILSELSPGELKNTLLQGQVARLNKLPGVGKKMAERLTVELKDKAEELIGGALSADERTSQALRPARSQAMEALKNLGYSLAQSHKAVDEAYQTLGSEDARVEDLVKTALKLV